MRIAIKHQALPLAFLRWALLVTLLTLVFSNVVVAKGETETSELEKRQALVSALKSPLPSTQQLGEDLLRNRGQGLEDFSEDELAAAKLSDYQHVLGIVKSVSGERVIARADEVLESNSVDDYVNFLETEWPELQIEDDRSFVTSLSTGDETSVVTQWAKEALAGSEDDLVNFVEKGHSEAIRHDQRRELYALSASPLPSVSRGAKIALKSNSDEVIDEFLSFGQFAMASADGVVKDVTEVSKQIDKQTRKAVAEYHSAARHGREAALATHGAWKATELTQKYAEEGKHAYQDAEVNVNKISQLAELAAASANEAAEAANDAHSAMLRAADAMRSAAAGLAETQKWNAEAQRLLGLTQQDAANASQARATADKLKSAGLASGDISKVASLLDSMSTQVNIAGTAAANASSHASAVAAAADQAANAAGVTAEAAARARNAAAFARAAAKRADAAAKRVDELVEQIGKKVLAVKAAADKAQKAAKNAVDSTHEAIKNAGLAEWNAEKVGEHAKASKQAADAVKANADLAKQIADLGEAAQEARFEQESSVRMEQAVARSKAENLRDGKAKVEEWKTQSETIIGKYQDAEALSDEELVEIENWVIDLVTKAPAPISVAAETVLIDGSDEALSLFVDLHFGEANFQYEQGRISELRISGDEEERALANAYAEPSEAEAHEFVETKLPELRKNRAKTSINGLVEKLSSSEARDSEDFQQTLKAAQNALNSDDSETIINFVQTGLIESLAEDARIVAYASLNGPGPYSKLLAKEAIADSKTERIRYLFQGRNAGLQYDYLLLSNEAIIDATLGRNAEMVKLAEAAAAGAAQVHEEALGNAGVARELANESIKLRDSAKGFADSAEKLLVKANQYLDFSLEKQKEAHAHAARAKAFAGSASEYAATATSYEVQANYEASQAQRAAVEARSLAAEAQQDFRATQGSMNILQGHYVQLQQTRSVQYADHIESELLPPEKSLWEVLRDEFGDDLIGLLKDITGITDLEQCVDGEIVSCVILIATYVTPIAKGGQVAFKAFRHRRELMSVARQIGPTIRKYREARKARLSDAIEPPCAIGNAQALVADGIYAAKSKACHRGRHLNDPDIQGRIPTTGKVYQVEVKNIRDQQDVTLLERWHPNSGLDSPKEIIQEGEKLVTKKFKEEEISRLRELVTDSTSKYKKDPRTRIDDKLFDEVVEKGESFALADAKKIEKASVRRLEKMKKKYPDLVKGRFGRAVGEDLLHNKMALFLAKRHQIKVRSSADNEDILHTDVRIDQTTLAKVEQEGGTGKILRRLGLKRPDVQIHGRFPNGDIKGVDQDAVDLYSKSLYIEFDTLLSQRDFEHVADIFTANPDATILSFKGGIDDLDPAIVNDIFLALN